jgi:hypothetical protein
VPVEEISDNGVFAVLVELVDLLHINIAPFKLCIVCIKVYSIELFSLARKKIIVQEQSFIFQQGYLIRASISAIHLWHRLSLPPALETNLDAE